MLAGKRSVRVGDLMQKEVALLLLERVKDPRVRGVTVTGIHLSADLRLAKIYYSVMGSKDQVERAQAGLDSAKGFIKRQVGLRMALKYIPEIIFLYDSSMERGRHMDMLFEEIRNSASGPEGSENSKESDSG
jgi:ribosome-binding factor A